MEEPESQPKSVILRIPQLPQYNQNSNSVSSSDFNPANIQQEEDDDEEEQGSDSFQFNNFKSRRDTSRLKLPPILATKPQREEPQPQNSRSLRVVLAKIKIDDQEKEKQCGAQTFKDLSPDNITDQRRKKMDRLSSGDSFAFEMLLAKKKRSKLKWICRNDSGKRIIWDMTIIVLALWNVFYIPYHIVFNNFITEIVPIKAVNYVLDFLFILDIVLNFFTSRINKQGEEIFDIKQIAKLYIRSAQFYIDIIAVLPFNLLPNLSFFSILTLLKLFRIRRLPKIIKKINLSDHSRSFFKLVNVILFLIIIFHLLGCVWCYTVLFDSTQWFPPLYWIDHVQLSFYKQTVLRQYLIALYYSQIGINSGQIGPRSLYQDVVGTLLIFSGMFINALIFGTMSQILFSLRRITYQEQSIIDMANTVMENMKLPMRDRRDVILYLRTMRATHLLQQQLVWFQNVISPTLKTLVRRHIYTKLITHNKSLKYLILKDQLEQDKMIDYLVQMFETELCEPEQLIISIGQQANEMYFIAKGSAQVCWKDMTTINFKRLRVLRENCHFGQVGLIYNCKRTMSVEMMKYSILAKLTKQSLLTVQHSYKIMEVFRACCWEYDDRYKRNLEKLLPSLPIFKSLTKDDLHKIIFQFQTISIQNQSFLFKQEDAQKGLYLIQSGFVMLSITTQGLNLPLKLLKRGHFIGYDSIFFASTHKTNAQCMNFRSAKSKSNLFTKDNTPSNMDLKHAMTRSLKRKNSKRKCEQLMTTNIQQNNDIFPAHHIRRVSIFSHNNQLYESQYYMQQSSARSLNNNKSRQSFQDRNLTRSDQLTTGTGFQAFAQNEIKKQSVKEVQKKKQNKNVYSGFVITRNCAVSFLSLEKLQALRDSIKQLDINIFTESQVVRQSLIRPYILDYYIPKQTMKACLLKNNTIYYKVQDGSRNIKFRFKNTVLYQMIRYRKQRKTRSIFQNLLDQIRNEQANNRKMTQNDLQEDKRNDTFLSFTHTPGLSSLTQQMTLNNFESKNQLANMFQESLQRIEKIAMQQSRKMQNIQKRLAYLDYIESQTVNNQAHNLSGQIMLPSYNKNIFEVQDFRAAQSGRINRQKKQLNHGQSYYMTKASLKSNDLDELLDFCDIDDNVKKIDSQ